MAEVNGGPAISLRDVGKTFEGREVFKGFSLDIPKGEVTILLGQSGQGKTTLLRMIAGQTPFSGRIEILGQVVEPDLSGKTHPAVVYITQQPNLWSNMTALDNVALVRRQLFQESQKVARTQAMDWLTRLDLAQVADSYPQTLSGGEQQRVSIARGLAADKQVLLLDEVTSNIDPNRREWVAKTLSEMAAEGKTMVLVTHDLATARLIGEKGFEVQVDKAVEVALAE